MIKNAELIASRNKKLHRHLIEVNSASKSQPNVKQLAEGTFKTVVVKNSFISRGIFNLQTY